MNDLNITSKSAYLLTVKLLNGIFNRYHRGKT